MKKKKRLEWPIIALITTFMGISVCHADGFPYPKVEFSADMTMNLKETDSGQTHTIQGKVYSAKGKERREIRRMGRTTAILKDRDSRKSWTLMPDQKMYMENQGPRFRKNPEAMIEDGELQLIKVGTEKLNGHTTTKYKIESVTQNEESFSGHAWFTSQNIPLRFLGSSFDSGRRMDMEINYSNINVSRQEPHLFIVPGDYRLVPAGMGGGSGAMSPAQMEQYKEMMKKYNRQ
jgi:hypothetical protein